MKSVPNEEKKKFFAENLKKKTLITDALKKKLF